MRTQVEKSDIWKIGRGCWYNEGGLKHLAKRKQIDNGPAK